MLKRTMDCFSFLAIVLISSATVQGGVVQWGGNGHYYELVQTAGLTYQEAAIAASTRNYKGLQGHLVVFDTNDYGSELEFVRNLVAEMHDNVYPAAYWIGASRADGAETWTWITGQLVPSGFSCTWSLNYLEGVGAEGAALFNTDQAVAVFGIDTTLIYGYIVEYEASEDSAESNTATPEPGSGLVWCAGFLGCFLWRSRKFGLRFRKSG